MKAPNQEPADAGVGGQAFLKGNGVGKTVPMGALR